LKRVLIGVLAAALLQLAAFAQNGSFTVLRASD